MGHRLTTVQVSKSIAESQAAKAVQESGWDTPLFRVEKIPNSVKSWE